MPSSLRILHVVDSLDRGGLEQVVCALSLEQLRNGHDVSVYCLHSLGSLAPGLQAAGVPVLGGKKRRGPDVAVLREIKRCLAGAPHPILHSHSMMPNYYGCCSRLLSLFSFTVVNTRHDMGSTRPGDLRERLYRLSVPLTKLVVMVSDRVRARFVDAGIVPQSKARIVLNGISFDAPPCTDPADRAAARRLLALTDAEQVIGCVGRLVELKDHATAVRAFVLLAQAHPTLHLVFIGAGPLQGLLTTQAAECGMADRISFLGERADVRVLLAGLDVFLMPSLTEGYSIALLEAAAAALPIVATRVGGNPEIIHDEESGLLVEAGDAAAMAGAIERLLARPAWAAQLGERASTWVRTRLSVRAMASSYDAIYAEALGGPPATES